MTTGRHSGWQKLILLLGVFPCCWSVQVSIKEKEYRVAKGDDVTLTCSFIPANPIKNNFVLAWDVVGVPSKAVASFFLNSPVDIAPSYEGRATLEVDVGRGEATLLLKKLTMEDSRHYQCSVRIPNDDEGTPIASTSVLVLEPPSKPVCTLQGRAEYFADITLTCKSEEGSPAPVYSWTSYSIENLPRQFPPKTTQEDGVLSLFNVTKETSGFFICLSKNNVGSASCNFTLAVMPPSRSFASTGIIIAAVAAGLLALGIIIFCCCRRKNKNEADDKGSHGDKVYYDKEGPEVGEPYMDDKSNTEKKKTNESENKDISPQSNYTIGGAGKTFDDDQHSYRSGLERHDGKGSDIDSHRYQGDRKDYYRGSRDHLDNQRDHYGSRERDDQRNRYGSRDRLDDQRDRHGSRDRLDDQRDRYGSRDRLDDQRDRYGSRDRLDDQRDRYGSRDRLDDQRDRYGSRDRLDDQRDRRGSRDRLDDQPVRSGSRDRLDEYRDQDLYRGSRDRIDYRDE
ncbi:PREDICTED: cell surface A33 antigen [Poecilia mexicana]|uniref:Ig-like domain-containing protein n=1 Tax=Poecilia mexicana TaxID=48701 RepID=A0A3B3Z3A2_9TELE|nr:PREDICTED: cell surface A33 antigen [Poecilia mexicana]